MSRTPREIAELTRRMVAGDPEVSFPDLFAEDGVMRFPFSAPGMPSELAGREAVRSFYGAAGAHGQALDIEGVDLLVRETDDPEVIVTEIEHHGHSHATGRPYRFRALGVIRVRDGEIVSYDDYMNPVAMAEILGRKPDLAAALSS
ncbi:nuclear transport factor 2 family protein [Pseudonocardia lacus]|uniref:nuclear transport factor 2 family protein n=1 Tax=Pseudonocardia lacus TaxID=2835865 RepID=UPI001BDC4294|nr:nuclear transport factor 2 family protein [Pseudonocardia lacus]